MGIWMGCGKLRKQREEQGGGGRVGASVGHHWHEMLTK